MDQFIEAHPVKFELPGIIEHYDISDILDSISKSGEYDEVIEHVVNEVIFDLDNLRPVYIERTQEGWKLCHCECSIEFKYKKEKDWELFNQQIWKFVCGVYASWDILTCSTNESMYPLGVKKSVYITQAYLDKVFS